MSMLFGTSGIGQQSTFSVVPAGQCPEVTLVLILVARVVKVDELFQALDVTVVKELLLEVRSGASVVGHCGGVMATLRADATCIWPSTVGILGPGRVRVGGGTEPAPEESS